MEVMVARRHLRPGSGFPRTLLMGSGYDEQLETVTLLVTAYYQEEEVVGPIGT